MSACSPLRVVNQYPGSEDEAPETDLPAEECGAGGHLCQQLPAVKDDVHVRMVARVHEESEWSLMTSLRRLFCCPWGHAVGRSLRKIRRSCSS